MNRSLVIGLSLVLGPWQALTPLAYGQFDLSAAKPSLVELSVGHSSLISFEAPIERASVNNADIADVVVVSPTELLVQGNQPGSTSVIVWRNGSNEFYTVRVEADLESLHRAIKSVYPEEKIQVQSSSGNIILSGIVSNQNIIDDVVAVATSFNLPVVNLLKLPKESFSGLIKKYFPKENIEVDESANGIVLTGRVTSQQVIDQAIELAGTRSAHVSNLLRLTDPTIDEILEQVVPTESFKAYRSGNSVIMSGRAKNFTNVTKAAEALATTTENVINLVDIPEREQVMIEVRFAEVNRTFTDTFGIDWFFQDSDFTQGGFGGGALDPQTPGTPQFGRIDNSEINLNQSIQQFFEYRNTIDLSTAIRMLQDKGLLRLLAEPNLIALSGEEASFLAGGEIPIPVVQDGGSVTIEFREYGVRLDFTPEVNPEGLITLAVAPEVSILDFGQGAVTIGGFQVPGLITRRADTTVQLKENQTLVIGGLLSQVDTNSDEQIPFFGNLPVLGKLFQSKNFREEETELLVMVTPRLMKPVDLDLPRKYSNKDQLDKVFSAQLSNPPYPDSRGEAIRDAMQGIYRAETEGVVEEDVTSIETDVDQGGVDYQPFPLGSKQISNEDRRTPIQKVVQKPAKKKSLSLDKPDYAYPKRNADKRVTQVAPKLSIAQPTQDTLAEDLRRAQQNGTLDLIEREQTDPYTDSLNNQNVNTGENGPHHNVTGPLNL